jgi:uncharacterized protein YndB with AHSA1/START domain
MSPTTPDDLDAMPVAEPFVITRDVDAPREVVFQAFTDPEHLKHWWGPKGFEVIASDMDLRPGGRYLYGLKAPDGSVMWGLFRYREIEAPERIVLVNSFSDENGGVTRHPWSANWPLLMRSVFSFEDLGNGKTRITISWAPINETGEERQTFDQGRPSMTQGWTGTFENLDIYLATLK